MNRDSKTGSGDDLREAIDLIHKEKLSLVQPDMMAALSGLIILRWADHYEAEQEAIASFEDNEHEPSFPKALRWRQWSGLRGTELREFLELQLLPALRDPGAGRLNGRLQRVQPALEQAIHRNVSRLLDRLMDWVCGLSFETPEDRRRAGDWFELVLRESLGEARFAGEFYTPDVLVELMAELADPKPGERIYDPCFGTGGFLSACARRLRQAVRRQSSNLWRSVQSENIFGMEINPAVYTIGLARVILAGVDHPGLECGDALERQVGRGRSKEGFDCILANPPWGHRTSQRFQHLSVPAPTLEGLFLQHIMAALRPGGRAIVLLPEGILFRTGPERLVRKNLLENFHVEGVISLPPALLMPYKSIKSSVVVFRRDKPAKTVRFMSAESAGKERGKSVPRPDAEEGASLIKESEARAFEAPTPTASFSQSRQAEAARREGIRIAGTFKAGRPGPSLWETPLRQLTDRGYELVPKRSGEEELQEYLDSLRKADPELPVVPLTKAGEIFSGVSYDKSVTTEDRADASVIGGLLRVADIQESGVCAPSLFLTNAAKRPPSPELRLHAGDIVISISGTVGKVAIIEKGVVESIPTKSIAVFRPRSGVSAQFIASLLRSSRFQNWLAGHAQGSSIRHLSIRSLKLLSIPLPGLSIQLSVSSEVSPESTDAAEALLSRLGRHWRDPIDDWLDNSPQIKAIMDRSAPTRNSLVLLDEFADSVFAVQRQIEKEQSEVGLLLTEFIRFLETRGSIGESKSVGMTERPIQEGDIGYNPPDWWMWLEEWAAAIKGVSKIPPGPDRVAVLMSHGRELATIDYITLGGGFSHSDFINDLVSRLAGLCSDEAGAVLNSYSVNAKIRPSYIPTGFDTEVQLSLQNTGCVGLRSFDVSTNPQIGFGSTSYLGPGDTIQVKLKLPAQMTVGKFDFTVRWLCRNLLGKNRNGEIPLTLEVLGVRQTVHAENLGPSPYIVGSPIDREEMFFGRHSVIEQIQRQLSATHRANVILLEGNRRTGKTSILKRLEGEGMLPGWIPVNCSFQGGEGDSEKAGLSTREVFRLMAKNLGLAVYRAGVPVWIPDAPPLDPKRKFEFQFQSALANYFKTERPFEAFESYLQSVLEAVQPRRILLMLDEFDKLQEGIDAHVTSAQVPENIRYLFHTYSGISGILTGSRRLKRLREEYWSALFGIGIRIAIEPLNREDARDLVMQPVQGRLVYVSQACDRVIELCARQPFLIQSLCNRIFENAAETGERTITLNAVSAAAGEMVRDNEHFRTLWDYAETPRRRMILVLCQRLENGPDPVTVSLLETEIERLGIIVPRDERIGSDVEFLRELEMLDLDTTSGIPTYRLTIPLMGDWIRQNIDFEDLKRIAKHEGEEKMR
ncbi:MAG: N-6 DNA methylase [Acidobacteriota bacterium]|jgi:type I restriction enzyme M protein